MQNWKSILIILYTAAAVLLLCGCVSEKKRLRSGPAFSRSERYGGGKGKRYNSPEVTKSRRIKLPGRSEVRNQPFIPARYEHFQGNPHLLPPNP